MHKVKAFFKRNKLSVLTVVMMAMTCSMAFAVDAPAPKSLVDSGLMNIIKGFGADVVKTVTDIVTVIVPTGLVLWAIGFAVSKGVGFLQRKASKAFR
ncbi:hypothetical protein PV797_06815 [Clostridiaceae bacterium M8S5]|nr:hypothetical protein PV797_13365 [Clostridiaceae bacterium M8S5]WDV47380.1 hypothetical protein PV797_06815 [Clostridiaceae bacterium M8S5]